MPKLPELPAIHLLRNQRVVLDRDLAKLYGVTTMALNQAIKRNVSRFPADFLIQLSRKETAHLISQSVISNPDTTGNQSDTSPTTHQSSALSERRGGHRKPSWAFTEHGAIMAAMILRSPRAVSMSVYVVRAFVRLRDELMTNAVILKRLEQIDRKLFEHDGVLRDVVEKLLPLLTAPPAPPRKEMGFHTTLKKP